DRPPHVDVEQVAFRKRALVIPRRNADALEGMGERTGRDAEIVRVAARYGEVLKTFADEMPFGLALFYGLHHRGHPANPNLRGVPYDPKLGWALHHAQAVEDLVHSFVLQRAAQFGPDGSQMRHEEAVTTDESEFPLVQPFFAKHACRGLRNVQSWANIIDVYLLEQGIGQVNNERRLALHWQNECAE